MSDNLVYTRISNTNTARIGTGEVVDGNAVKSEYVGEVIIESHVNIDGMILPVVEIGKYSFRWCSQITRVKIPCTVVALRDRCLDYMTSLKELIITGSVKIVEEYFIGAIGGNLGRITFLGLRDLNHNEKTTYIAAAYNKAVLVPFNYRGTTFLNKNIMRSKKISAFIDCQRYTMRAKSRIYHINAFTYFLIFCVTYQ